MATPRTPNRRPALAPPTTPRRPRALCTPLSAASPHIVTPLSPSPLRTVCGKQLEFKQRVARRLFFTPQHGSQAHIPPSPPLTPSTPFAMAAAQAAAPSLSPLHVHRHIHYHYHEHPSAASASEGRPATPQTRADKDPVGAAPVSTPLPAFQLGSPVSLQRRHKRAKTHHGEPAH